MSCGLESVDSILECKLFCSLGTGQDSPDCYALHSMYISILCYVYYHNIIVINICLSCRRRGRQKK